ncbi:HEPN domain-containing protein [Rubrivirga sp.]|uniref:HEPN domain-containing protein n=1 Tax=Rubrivirga sp. TaxID=1885344 RepID=UPI003B52958F
MSDREHARALPALAERDLLALRAMIPNRDIADEIVGFRAQQAAEKALKAWLTADSKDYSRTHDLSALLGSLVDAGHDVAAFLALVRLNVFAVRFRYEALGPATPFADRKEIADEIDSLLAVVRAHVTEG